MKNSGVSPKARWDRHVPETGGGPVDEALDALIEVTAHFKHGKIYPQRFLWNQKEYPVDRITYNWQERQGQALISYFSVASAEELYQISFNNTSFGWRLDKII